MRQARTSWSVATALVVVAAACAASPTGGPPTGASRLPTSPPETGQAGSPVVTVGASPTALIGWQRSPDQAAFANAALHGVVWIGERFVALTRDGRLLESPDARTWVVEPAVATDAWTDGPDLLAAGPGGAIGVGGGNGGPIAIWRSGDGLSWTRAEAQAAFETRGGAFEQVNAAIGTADGWLAVGGGQYHSTAPDLRAAIVLASSDGRHWTRLPDATGLDHAEMNGVTHGPSGYIAVGAVVGRSPAGVAELHPALWTSLDGRSWSRSRNVPAPALPAVAADTSRTDVILDGVAVLGRRLVVVGEVDRSSPAGGAAVASSAAVAWWSDGVAWTEVSLDSAPFEPPASLQVVGGGLLALGTSFGTGCAAGAWVSMDGAAWHCLGNDPTFSGFAIHAAAASPKAEVLVGFDDTADSTGNSAVWTRALP